MVSEETINLQMTILMSSCLYAVATGVACHFVLQALFRLDDHRIAVWHREATRWRCLREASTAFRSFQPWIIGLSQWIEREMAWLVEPEFSNTKFGRIQAISVQLFLGNMKRLASALRSLSSVEPWSISEVAATAVLVATAVTLSAALLLVDDKISLRGALVLVLTWLTVYRLWCRSYLVRGERRRRSVRRFLPHAMDSIAMVMASGDTFRTGLETIVRDFPDHPLSVELLRLRNELDRGQTMASALQATAASIGLPEFDELVRVLARIHQHGIPAADSFARLAKQLRVSHLRHMEEEVGRAEASIAMPTMLVMASCMIVAAAPFVLSIIESSFFE